MARLVLVHLSVPYLACLKSSLAGFSLMGIDRLWRTTSRLAGNQRGQGNTLTEKNFNMLAKLETFAEEKDHPMVELAIAWLLGNSAVSSVIAGATKNEQVTTNAKAADWVLTPEHMTEIDAILRTGD